MQPITVTSDWHLGAIRSGGTTPATAFKLRQKLLKQFADALSGIDTELILLGDLFDSVNIPMSDLLETLTLLDNWLRLKRHKLYAVPGNHDLGSNSTVLSSFQFLGKVLKSRYPEQVTYVTNGTLISEQIYIIPHVPNNDLLNLELGKVPEVDYLMCHANWDNKFTQQSDHSLNISMEQAINLKVKHIIFAHIHQQASALDGKVVVIGNPVPSSVSDCLGNTSKSMLRITDAGIERIPTWQAEGSFSRQDWRSLTDVGDFIRVGGEATPEEAGAVVTAISKFRSQSKALIITNAVSIGGVEIGDINLSLEQIQSFSVLDALLELLTPAEGLVITNLIRENSINV